MGLAALFIESCVVMLAGYGLGHSPPHKFDSDLDTP